jgi:proline iminopeptidase
MVSAFANVQVNNSGHLAVSEVHSIYWEECGNPNGVPIIYLHGGPGAGVDESCRRVHPPFPLPHVYQARITCHVPCC